MSVVYRHLYINIRRFFGAKFHLLFYIFMYKIMCMYCSHVYISRYGFSPDRPLKLERHSPKSVCSLLSSELLEFRQLLIAVQLILHSKVYPPSNPHARCMAKTMFQLGGKWVSELFPISTSIIFNWKVIIFDKYVSWLHGFHFDFKCFLYKLYTVCLHHKFPTHPLETT